MSTIIIMDVLLLVTLMILGVPVALTFVAAAVFLVVFGDYGSTTFLITSGFSKVASVVLLAIPLYILAGAIMTQGGIALRLLEFADSFFGRFRSGLGFVVVVTTAVFGAISGMASSAVAAIYELLHAPTLEEGIVATVGCGGDTDTNAAICGALLGAVNGRDAVPGKWVDRIVKCRPTPGTTRPRPEEYWPDDGLRLAEHLLQAGATTQ